MELQTSITVTISNPQGLAAELFLERLTKSPEGLAELIHVAIKERYFEAASQAMMSYNDAPFTFTYRQ